MRPRVALLFAALAACQRAAPAPPAPAAPAQRFVALSPEGMVTAEVRTATLAPQTFGPHLSVAATIEADPQRIAHVGARVPGRVAVVLVALGEQVRRNQALIEVDASELHQTVLDFQTAVARDREASDALSRQRQLVAEHVGAERDLRRAEADAAAASAAHREAQEHLRFLGLSSGDIGQVRSGSNRVDRSIVRAPIDGRVETLDVSIGQGVNATETLATIARLDVVWAALRVYERDLSGVERGASVAIQVVSYPERTFTGTIAFVGAVVDPTTRTIEVRASLANPDGALRPGMTARASLAVRGEAGALWLPVEAVQPHEGGSGVFVRTAERRFELRPVVVGPEQDGFVPLRSGLVAGTEVVVHGALALRGELERAEMEE